MWVSVVGLGLLASLPVWLLVWDHADGRSLNLFTLCLCVVFAVAGLYGITLVSTARIRLLADRVEYSDLLRSKTIRIADIAGLRRDSDMILRLAHRERRSGDLTLPADVLRHPAWVEWLQTLPNLDVEDFEKDHAALEGDRRLGSDEETRRAALANLKRFSGLASLAGFGVALWALFYPRPYDIAALACLAAPVLAILIAGRWQGLVRLLADKDEWAGAGVAGLWLTPVFAAVLFGLRETVVDWPAGLAFAVPGALLFMAASAWADTKLRNALGLAIAGAIGFAWSWSAVMFGNTYLDHAKPVLAEASVSERLGEPGHEPRLALKSAGLPDAVEAPVSAERFHTSPPGARVCIQMHPGRFGLRYIAVVDCPGTPATE